MNKGLHLNNIDYQWNEEKNKILIRDRNISFEEIVNSINGNGLKTIIKNPSSNFDNQKSYVVEVNEYIYLVPFVKNGNEIFLKTIYPSRKHKKIYL